LDARLGPVDRLTITWEEGSKRGVAVADATVEELLWLKVQPGAVVVDASYRLKAVKGRVYRLQIVADSRVRLLPSPPDRGVFRVESRSDDSQTIRVELPEAVTDESTLRASFLVTETSGVGRIRLPRIEVASARTTRRWMAVSVDPALAFEEAGHTELETLAIPQFATAWGEDEALPQRAYSLPPRGDVPWSLATRPHKPKTTVEQELTVRFGRRNAQLLFDARLNATAGYHFQHQINGPRGLQVTSVSVLVGDAERVARWAADESGTVTVFLDGPVTGEQRLRLQAKLPIKLGKKMDLPRILVQGAEVEASRFQVYRKPPVSVTIVQTTDLEPVTETSPDENGKDENGRIARWIAQGAKAAAVLEVSPNNPVVEGTLITLMRRDLSGWTAEIDYRVRVEDGVADHFRFHVPANWGDSLSVDPEAEIKWLDLPGENRRQLLLRPPAAVEGDWRVRISSPLVVAAGDRIRVPEVVPLDADRLQRLLIVPTQLQQQRVAWDTLGLSEIPLPEGFGATTGARPSFACYRVVGRQSWAALKSVSRDSGVPQVRLADIRVAWKTDHTCHGVAWFDLEPAGLTNCTVEVPEGLQLVHAVVAGKPAIVQPLEENGHWRLTLASSQLPQRIELVFEGKLTPDSSVRGAWSAEAPTLQGLNVERTLWTLRGPPGVELELPEAPGSRIDAGRLEMYRMKAATAVADLPSDVLEESTREEIDRWYLLWARRLAASRNRMARRGLESDADSRVAESELQRLDREHLELAERLGVSHLRSRATAETARNAAPPELFDDVTACRAPVARCMFQGAVDRVAVRQERADAGDLPLRIFVALALAAATALATVFLRRHAAREWLVRWPRAMAVLIGLAWWLWLTPSWLGWVIVAIGLASSVRSVPVTAKELTGSSIISRTALEQTRR